MAKMTFYQQNDGQLGAKPPPHLSKLAGETWRKIVPFLIGTDRVGRIDSTLVVLATYDGLGVAIPLNGKTHQLAHRLRLPGISAYKPSKRLYDVGNTFHYKEGSPGNQRRCKNDYLWEPC
ncbi:hypothetical protein HCZ54_07460 [Limosilactobacillus fermentum]